MGLAVWGWLYGAGRRDGLRHVARAPNPAVTLNRLRLGKSMSYEKECCSSRLRNPLILRRNSAFYRKSVTAGVDRRYPVGQGHQIAVQSIPQHEIHPADQRFVIGDDIGIEEFRPVQFLHPFVEIPILRPGILAQGIPGFLLLGRGTPEASSSPRFRLASSG